MPRPPRCDIFVPSESAHLFVSSRCVRECVLLGTDPITGKCFDHRKAWLENRIKHFAGQFAIDLQSYSIESNEISFVLRTRPDLVKRWSDREVALRWLRICPSRKDKHGNAKPPKEEEINNFLECRSTVEEARSRLSDVSWWVRLILQPLAAIANHEEALKGNFWQGRYTATKLLDDLSILAAAVLVDLKQVRAANIAWPAFSLYTSFGKRLEAVAIPRYAQDRNALASPPDAFLSPLIAENQKVNARELSSQVDFSKRGYRASDEPILHLDASDYLELLKWTYSLGKGQIGTICQSSGNKSYQIWNEENGGGHLGLSISDLPLPFMPEVLRRQKVDLETWQWMTSRFESVYYLAAGSSSSLLTHSTRISKRPFRLRADCFGSLAVTA